MMAYDTKGYFFKNLEICFSGYFQNDWKNWKECLGTLFLSVNVCISEIFYNVSKHSLIFTTFLKKTRNMFRNTEFQFLNTVYKHILLEV